MEESNVPPEEQSKKQLTVEQSTDGKPKEITVEELINDKNRWEYSHVEYEVNPDGTKVVKKIVADRETKYERRDFYLRLFASLAVLLSFAGLLLNFLQQQRQTESQIRQQKALFQLGIFDKAIANINNLSTDNFKDSNYRKAKSELKYETFPRIILLNDSVLVKLFSDFYPLVEMNEHLAILIDSIRNFPRCQWYMRRTISAYFRAKLESRNFDVENYRAANRIEKMWMYFAGEIENFDSVGTIEIFESSFTRDSAQLFYERIHNGLLNVQEHLDSCIDVFDRIRNAGASGQSLETNDLQIPPIVIFPYPETPI